MAAAPRTSTSALEAELLSRGHEFSFFQAMRLLHLLALQQGEGSTPLHVYARPEASLAFPAGDVVNVERRDDGYRIDATFLGLYGSASPLPAFYSEEILAGASADKPAAREFLDIINHRLFALFYQCSLKYRLFYNLAQQERSECLVRLLCLIGMGSANSGEIAQRRELLRFAALLSHHPRSALGLAALLRQAFGVPADVIQCEPRQVAVPPDQRLKCGVSGCTLGEDAVLGCEVADRSGKFLVRLGPLDREQFAVLLPGSEAFRQLRSLVEIYLVDQLEWDVELIHRVEDLPATVLGCECGGRLGWDTWIAPDAVPAEPSVMFSGRG
ncbi:type VI secretion system baseplate subunit TssG [Geomesophilobacter sediminis]|uniref:Type VI secretion system baseplate subunit TssG n=1 Tax=Geomesophilobacter sediminis TaxID=2798584 RepID=A0A8J7LY79_9BACT|nr:type VI secretion system baseplate subunit TssG [Geomesophilobacter sediminis]MBJ6724516.1 type VI secretion system baseplate subunit TssG [Geomesophilobacter sediminis]